MKKLRKGGILLSKVHQLSGRIFNRLLKDSRFDELNGAQGRILFVLWEQDDIPITDLAKKSMLTKSTLTAMLDKLETTGFIRRVSDPSDRRKIRIQRTGKDRDFQKLFTRVSEDMTGIWYDGFSNEEVESFETYLQRVLDNLISWESHS
ncbi:MarR family winged helix-turn-helix transcriptional regulator [Spirochaeta isovalerica]|uniref:DNA-binding MarR family transcriptional regulator n=1 Tax=Spirochaeta isovalerica TaxID=150 RepID=A0A841RHJ4_9SPIO|nr:MarR family transcriptional regulator [Spirochaeta isovalerica]MBB6481772.1 DNA-binding MarR family transcriptional regulator [Spirochaeta isovalerica]